MTCLACSNFRMRFEADYSETTPGAGFVASCEVGRYYREGKTIRDEEDFYRIIRTATDCEAYVERASICVKCGARRRKRYDGRGE